MRYWPLFQTDKFEDVEQQKEPWTECLETKGLASILALTSHVALDQSFIFQTAISSRKTWVRAASDIGYDPPLAKISNIHVSKWERASRKPIRTALQIRIPKQKKWWRENNTFTFFSWTKESPLIISPLSVYKDDLRSWVSKSKLFGVNLLLSLKLQQHQMIL